LNLENHQFLQSLCYLFITTMEVTAHIYAPFNIDVLPPTVNVGKIGPNVKYRETMQLCLIGSISTQSLGSTTLRYVIFRQPSSC